ncbi:MAG TPA: DNA polymerase III subunit gamma/tau [Acetobacteraceae bacterium]|nr:DNA polymerase III subunit gamma/tau [Acetobacteraceae bacterium]
MAGLFENSAPPDPVPPAGPGLFGPAEAAPAASYRVLARKYRPQRLADLIGQETMVRTLTNAFATGRVAHAFMLTGVRGVGKTSTARIIARALNCTGPDGTGGPTAEPCLVCPNCAAILAERHPDVVEMDAASRTGVDDVREIIEATRFRPLQARKKVFIIDEVHMLSRNAFNALLKTLEEPPPHVAFVFATTEVRKVPLTVLSRCQRFDLRRLGVAELAAHFARIAEEEAVAITKEALAVIARAADGSVRDGLSLLDQAIAQGGSGEGGPISADSVASMLGMADRESVFDLLEAVMAGKPAAALALSDAALARGTDAGLLLVDLAELLHNVSRIKAAPALAESAELPEAERTRGAALAQRLSVPVLGRAWQMVLKGIQEVEGAPDRRAAAEMVLIRLCHVAELPPPGELVRMLSGGQAAGGAVTGTAPPGPGGGPVGAMRASVGGPAMGAPIADPVAAAPPAMPESFRAVVGLAREAREALLAAQLLHHVHLVRFAPPVIEINPEPEAPRDLAARLGKLLQEATGTRWTIALAAEPGEPTLAEQERAEELARRDEASRHPLVSAILAAFPGAEIAAVRDVESGAPELEDAPAAEPPPDNEPPDNEAEEP